MSESVGRRTGHDSVAPASPCVCKRTAFLVAAALITGLWPGVAQPAVAQARRALEGAAAAQPAGLQAAHPYARHVAEASRRFGIPEAWIWSVMRVESAGNPAATSRAGAMGLMQILPGTYAELRSRYGLGPDAYDVRDNILAGAAYLREMHDRYGTTGMLAAYNAGPGRWEDHLARGRYLPTETVAYLARLGPIVGGSAAPSTTAVVHVDRYAWRGASLFVVLGDRASPEPSAQIETTSPTTTEREAWATTETTSPASSPPASGLFAVRRPE